MKKELENAPPEPREPAAREFSELLDSYDSAVWLAGRKMATEGDGARKNELRSKILAYSAELRAERDNAKDDAALSNELYRHHSALIGKIQAIVDKAFPDSRWAELDVLHQGVWKILKRAEAAEASLLQAHKLLSEAHENLVSVHICGTVPAESNLSAMCGMNAQRIAEFKLASTSAPEGDV